MLNRMQFGASSGHDSKKGLTLSALSDPSTQLIRFACSNFPRLLLLRDYLSTVRSLACPDGYVFVREGTGVSNYTASKMQVTRRVPIGVHFVVNTRRFTTAAPPRPNYFQALGVRPADCGSKVCTCAPFSSSAALHAEGRLTGASKDPTQEGEDAAAKTNIHEAIAQEKEKQTRAPWHREGSNKPPVARQRSAGAMTKGVYRGTDPPT